MHFVTVYNLSFVHILYSFAICVKTMCLNNCAKQNVLSTGRLENIDKLDSDVIMTCDYMMMTGRPIAPNYL